MNLPNKIKPLLTALLLCGTSSARAADAPNIVLIMSDDMGFSDLGCYGGEINTPHLDRLAKHGVRFSQFYNAARCCPTRAALLSGVYQHQAGIGLMTGNKKLPGYRGELGRNVVSIAEALSTAGLVSRNSITTESADAQSVGMPALGPISDRACVWSDNETGPETDPENVMKLMAVALAGWINQQEEKMSGLAVCFATTTGTRHETDDSSFWTLRDPAKLGSAR